MRSPEELVPRRGKVSSPRLSDGFWWQHWPWSRPVLFNHHPQSLGLEMHPRVPISPLKEPRRFAGNIVPQPRALRLVESVQSDAPQDEGRPTGAGDSTLELLLPRC